MEEIKYKIYNGRPAVVTEALTKLYDAVVSKLSANPSSLPLKFTQLTEQQCPELFLLWKETKSIRPVVAIACSSILTNLVKQGMLDGASVMSSLLASASQIQCPQGLVSSIGSLLSLMPAAQPAFGITVNQHPFISLLRASPTTMWPFVVQEIQKIVDSNLAGIELTTPIFMFAFCNPHQLEYLSPLRQALKRILFSKIENENAVRLAHRICEWLVYSGQGTFFENLSFVLEFLSLGQMRPQDAALLCSLAIRAVDLGQDPTTILSRLKSFLKNNPLDFTTSNVLIILLSKLFESSPYIYYSPIVDLALRVFEAGNVVPLAAGVIVTPVLHVMSFPSPLTADMWSHGVKLMKIAISKLETSADQDLDTKCQGERTYHWDPKVRLAYQTVRLIFELQKSRSKSVLWLKSIARSDLTESSCSSLFTLLCSMVLTQDCDASVGQLALQQLLRLVDKQLALAPLALATIMYQLAASTRSSGKSENISIFIYHLLTSLPPLAKDRCCVGQILQVIESLGSRPNLRPLKLRLLYDLWLIETRCYPYLQRALEEPGCNLSKAKVAKLICQKQPVRHGADLLPLFSRLLSDCTDVNDTTVATLAVEGITILCKEGVIDLKTTVAVLSPKLRCDKRPEVVASFCSLLGVSATFKLNSDEYQQFLRETLTVLWANTVESEPALVRRRAIESICHFPILEHQLTMLPDKVKSNLKLPPALSATPGEAVRNPEDVLDYIPGECWVRLLKTAPEEDVSAYEKLLAVLIKEEVEECLPRSVYFLGSRKEEPLNYNYLHEKSVLRAVVACLQSEVNMEEFPDVKKCCLSILNQELGKPFPPLDWSNLKLEDKLKPLLFKILASQAKHSRSAKLLVESSMTGTLSFKLAPEVCCQLKHLVGLIPDSQLEDYLSNSLQIWMTSATRDIESRNSFETILKNVASFLKDVPPVQESSKEIICSALEGLSDDFPDCESELYEIYLDAITEMPMLNLEKISNPVSWWEINDVKMYRSLSIRSAMAGSHQTETPMFWLNDCVEIITRRGGEIGVSTFDFFLLTLANVASRCRVKSVQSNVDWLLELMGHIRSHLRQELSSKRSQQIPCKISQQVPDKISEGFLFLFDVFAVAVIVFSESETLAANVERDVCTYNRRAERLALLPLATARLLDNELDSISPWKRLGPPLAEWMLLVKQKVQETSISGPTIGETANSVHLDIIEKCLSSFKVVDKYSEASMWGKLVPMS